MEEKLETKQEEAPVKKKKVSRVSVETNKVISSLVEAVHSIEVPDNTEAVVGIIQNEIDALKEELSVSLSDALRNLATATNSNREADHLLLSEIAQKPRDIIYQQSITALNERLDELGDRVSSIISDTVEKTNNLSGVVSGKFDDLVNSVDKKLELIKEDGATRSQLYVEAIKDNINGVANTVKEIVQNKPEAPGITSEDIGKISTNLDSSIVGLADSLVNELDCIRADIANVSEEVKKAPEIVPEEKEDTGAVPVDPDLERKVEEMIRDNTQKNVVLYSERINTKFLGVLVATAFNIILTVINIFV